MSMFNPHMQKIEAEIEEMMNGVQVSHTLKHSVFDGTDSNFIRLLEEIQQLGMRVSII